MNAPVLDTLRCAQTLKAAGFRDEQAEAMAHILSDSLADVVTKADLDNAIAGAKSELKAAFKTEIARQDAKFDAKFDRMEQKFDARFGTVEQRFDTRLGATEQTFDAKLDHTVALLKGDIAKLHERIDRLEGRLNERIDGVEGRLNERIDGLEGKLTVIASINIVMLAAMFAFVFGAIVAPNLSWGEPPAPPTQPPLEAQPANPTPSPST